MRIGLNAGHTLTGAGSGAVGVLSESNETRRVVNELTKRFNESGVEVVDCTIDHAASQSEYLQRAVAMANRQDLDWFISIHFNASASKNGKGVEAYTYKGRQYQDAVEVCNYIAAQGFENRGVKDGSGLYVIRKTKAKAILIEVCFVNEPDASQYNQKFNEVCNAIAYALADYVAPVAQTKPQAPAVLPEKQKYVKVICDNLNVHKTPDWNKSSVCMVVNKNEVFTIAEGPFTVGGGSMCKLKSGLYITASSKYVQIIEK